jgi:hypothetical protein
MPLDTIQKVIVFSLRHQRCCQILLGVMINTYILLHIRAATQYSQMARQISPNRGIVIVME